MPCHVTKYLYKISKQVESAAIAVAMAKLGNLLHNMVRLIC